MKHNLKISIYFFICQLLYYPFPKCYAQSPLFNAPLHQEYNGHNYIRITKETFDKVGDKWVKSPEVAKSNLYLSGDNFIVTYDDENKDKVIVAGNSKYCFAIYRKDINEQWILAYVYLGKWIDIFEQSIFNDFSSMYYYFLPINHSFFDIGFYNSNYHKLNNVTIKTISESQDAIEYEIKGTGKAGDIVYPLHYRFTFDKSNKAIVFTESLDSKFPNRGIIKSISNGLVKTVEQYNPSQKTIITYEIIDTPNFTNEAVTLSDYGLPEPEGVVWEKPTPNWVWLLVVAGCLALVAVILGTLKRRLARA